MFRKIYDCPSEGLAEAHIRGLGRQLNSPDLTPKRKILNTKVYGLGLGVVQKGFESREEIAFNLQGLLPKLLPTQELTGQSGNPKPKPNPHQTRKGHSANPDWNLLRPEENKQL